MEYQTSSNNSSAASSPVIQAWPIGSPSSISSSSSTSSTWSQASSTSSSLNCAFPSWPTGPTLSNPFQSQNGVPNSYISDFDLFGDDLLDEDSLPYLDEAPAPPRVFPVQAAPLPPLYAKEKPKKRRRSSRKPVRAAKPMTPIAESPAAPE